VETSDQLRAAIQRGSAAQALMENNHFNELITELRQTYIEKWVDCKTVDGREKIHAAMLAVDDILSLLMGQISDAQTAKDALDDSDDGYSADMPYWPDNLLDDN